MARINQNLSDVEGQLGGSPVPPGQYLTMITNSEVKQTRSGKNMLTLEFRIAEGMHTGRKLFENFMLDIENKVARSRLKSVAIAGKHRNPNNIEESEELHGCYVMLKVTVENDAEYGMQNRIKAFDMPEGVPAHAPITPGTAYPPPPMNPAYPPPPPMMPPPPPMPQYQQQQFPQTPVVAPAPMAAPLMPEVQQAAAAGSAPAYPWAK